MIRLLPPLFVLACTATPACAHHGVAGVGAAAIEGPGAPVESASSGLLPQGATLLSLKLDQAAFRRVDPSASEADHARFWMLGVGHGFTPWLSAYAFAPYHIKVDTPDPSGAAKYDTRGFADSSLLLQVGFKHEPGEGLRLLPANESLDDLEDWHFSLFAGATVPHGNPNLRSPSGAIEPGKSTGFGKPSANLGGTASKMLTRDLTLFLEASALRFRQHTYADAGTMRFGAEDRLNAALAWRLFGDARRQRRLDGVLELQHLALGKDRANGVDDENSGGRILYLLPGLRYYHGKASFAIGLKRPIAARLNQATARQQGAEGTEKYRLIFSASYLF